MKVSYFNSHRSIHPLVFSVRSSNTEPQSNNTNEKGASLLQKLLLVPVAWQALRGEEGKAISDHRAEWLDIYA